LDVAMDAFHQLDADVRVENRRRDGDRCAPGDEIAVVSGRARALLVGERTALNLLQRMSGIATQARRFVDAAGGRITVLDTRKTTPGLRLLEKYAVRAGGATNHRVGLYDAVLIKENHIRLAGSVKAALDRLRAETQGTTIEIQTETHDAVEQALAAGDTLLLLDNKTTDAHR